MRFHKLDLNLLVAMDALLQERSVGLAADRLHLSQSAASSALGRLREYFGDDLLVLKGRAMVLTPRAEELMGPLRAVLDQIQNTIAVSQSFDPAVSDRRLAIMASDYSVDVLLRPALLAFEEEAPSMTFEITPLGDNLVEELQRGRADLLITVDSAISTEHPYVQLYKDDYVVVGWSGNRALAGPMTKELYGSLGHVVIRLGRQRLPSVEEWALKSRSVNRRIEVVAPTFASVANIVASSQRIATMHRRHAERAARSLPLKLMELPFAIPPIRQMAQWSSSSTNDPALAWMVERLRQIATAPDF